LFLGETLEVSSGCRRQPDNNTAFRWNAPIISRYVTENLSLSETRQNAEVTFHGHFWKQESLSIVSILVSKTKRIAQHTMLLTLCRFHPCTDSNLAITQIEPK
jgi:hypothetical protein